MAKKLPPALEAQEVALLMERVLEGDHNAAHQLILGHMRLASVIASRWARVLPESRREELLGVALLALVDATNRIMTKVATTDNFGAYIAVYVRGKVLNFLKVDYLVRPPQNSAWLIERIKIDGPEVVSMLFSVIEYMEYDEDLPDNEYTVEGKADPRFDNTEAEFTSFAHLTERDEIMLDMRLQGATLNEIAQKIGLSIEGVRKRLRKLGEVLTKYLGREPV